MKKQLKSILVKTEIPDPAKDLTGKRFGKWVVLGYAGRKVYQSVGAKSSMQIWLCHCDCGVQKSIPQGNLLSKLSTQCLRCARIRHGIPRTKLFLAWLSLMQLGTLPKEWQDYEAFSKAVGEPPDDAARLSKYERTKSHGPGNTYWAMPKKDYLPRQIPEDIKARHISQYRVLMKIPTAKTKDEMIQSMIAARKEGHTYGWIAIAAGFTRQRVHQIITKQLGKRK